MRASLKNGDTINVEQPTRFMGVGFSLNAKQCRKLNRWLADVHRDVVARQVRWLDDQVGAGRKAPWRSVPYYGAAGGGLSFTFAANGLGTFCKVTEAITKRTLDLSEYDEW